MDYRSRYSEADRARIYRSFVWASDIKNGPAEQSEEASGFFAAFKVRCPVTTPIPGSERECRAERGQLPYCLVPVGGV